MGFSKLPTISSGRRQPTSIRNTYMLEMFITIGNTGFGQEIIDGKGLCRREEVYGQEKCQNDVVKSIGGEVCEVEGKKIHTDVLQEQAGRQLGLNHSGFYAKT